MNSITQQDTICAIATAPGGAIGIIRVSGEDSFTIVDKLFRPSRIGGKLLAERKSHTVTFGRIIDSDGEIVDEVLVTVFRKPHSYTGENSIEISCHASSYILQRVMSLLVEGGCRLANPGEYTQRAFLNGKMDLSQAEAVADLITSHSSAAHHMAMRQMRGAFSSELSSLRERLLHLTSLMELELDFSDHEELEFADRTQLDEVASQIEDKVARLAASFRLGNAIKKGVPVAIVGETNVGKSTLLNCLVGEERSIVSNIKGTTRDVIEDVVNISGIDFRFIDTAGLRDTKDEIEAIGVNRAYQKIKGAEIVLLLIDAKDAIRQLAGISPKVFPLAKDKNIVIVLNKCDLCAPSIRVPEGFGIVNISAKYGEGIDTLKEQLLKFIQFDALSDNDIVVSNIRHYEALTQAIAAIRRVRTGLFQGIPTDLVSEDLRDCLSCLASITGGQIATDEVLGNIFKNFCVGK